MTIKELQSKGFKKSTVIGLFLTNKGKAYNYSTNNDLKVLKRGKVIVNGKEYNLAKLVLETFKKIPVRNGEIIFVNGVKTDFDFNNLEYKTPETLYTAPPEASIINCIRLYFEVQKKFNRHSVFYKSNMKYIATKRGFIHLQSDKDFNLFLEWIKALSQSKAKISKLNGYSITNGTSAINKYLTLLVNECLQDQENGILQKKDFELKPPTATEKNKKTNETAQKMGLTFRIPLRKKAPDKFKGL